MKRSDPVTPETIALIAKPLKAKIGAHMRLLGTGCDAYTYQRARADSDLAAQQAAYLIKHLDNRHDAVQLAHAVGMPGYVNMR
jgi:hypothetical protein